MRKAWQGVLLCVLACLPAAPARATFHIIVIDQAFFGFSEAPGAQYVMLRTEAVVQTLVHQQPVTIFGATGAPLGDFASFCVGTPPSKCDFPKVSPACAGGGCPAAISSNDSRMLIATPWAAGLFCVTPDLTATQALPYPDGRVCWADCALEPVICSSGPVDCVAYGNFTGDNGMFGPPAAAPPLGEALVGAPSRLNQFSPALTSAAVCVGGSKANMACAVPADCPGGACVQCPQNSCANLLTSVAGFSPGAPAPRNFHGDLGALDGVAGDADGSGTVDAADVDAEVGALFAADQRCGLPVSQRGADANLDTRVGAADLIATVQIATAPPMQGS